MRSIAPLAALLLLTGCLGDRAPGLATVAGASPSARVSPAPPPGGRGLASSCGMTKVWSGGAVPAWARENAPAVPYAIASPELAVGYLLSYPLKAGLDANKILWYVRTERGGRPLQATGHPLGFPAPAVQFASDADSGPGWIYPSGPRAPAAGCWHFDLAWNGSRAGVDLLFT